MGCARRPSVGCAPLSPGKGGTRGRRSSGPPRAPPPERAESCAMPAKNGPGLDEQDCVTPSWRHSCRQDNEALPGSPPNTTGELPLCDDKLLTKERVLRDQVTQWRTRSAAIPETNRRKSIMCPSYTVYARGCNLWSGRPLPGAWFRRLQQSSLLNDFDLSIDSTIRPGRPSGRPGRPSGLFPSRIHG